MLILTFNDVVLKVLNSEMMIVNIVFLILKHLPITLTILVIKLELLFTSHKQIIIRVSKSFRQNQPILHAIGSYGHH